MEGTIWWALATGFITGGVWVGILLLRRERRGAQPRAQIEDMQRRLDELDDVGTRLADIEERLDFTERLLAEERAAGRLPPRNPGPPTP